MILLQCNLPSQTNVFCTGCPGWDHWPPPHTGILSINHTIHLPKFKKKTFVLQVHKITHLKIWCSLNGNLGKFFNIMWSCKYACPMCKIFYNKIEWAKNLRESHKQAYFATKNLQHWFKKKLFWSQSCHVFTKSLGKHC